jgi:ABC-type antimicrobial peptide transport system permease subunit
MRELVLDILVGVVFGGAVGWASYAGLYDQSVHTRGQSARSLPILFWRWSLMCAAIGAVIGGVLMWRVRHGG